MAVIHTGGRGGKKHHALYKGPDNHSKGGQAASDHASHQGDDQLSHAPGGESQVEIVYSQESQHDCQQAGRYTAFLRIARRRHIVLGRIIRLLRGLAVLWGLILGAAVLWSPILPLAVGGSPVLRGAIGRLVVLRRLLVFGFGLGRFRCPRGLWRVEGVVLKGLGLIGVQRQVGNMASIRRGALRGFFRLGAAASS